MNNLPFTKGARYYDVIYKNRNHVREVNQIDRLVKILHPPSKKMIDLGCGTGSHALAFSKKGYAVTGVDVSTAMLGVAKIKSKEAGQRVCFRKANVLDLHVTNEYGVAISLFHVLSYQLTNRDVKSFFISAFRCLQNDGIFIFDCWYGPGVRRHQPKTQTKTGRGENFSYIKTKTPLHNKDGHTVRVMHNITINDDDKKTTTYTEVHTLRYFFYHEIKALLASCGFSLRKWGVLQNGLRAPLTAPWSVVFVAKKSTVPPGSMK